MRVLTLSLAALFGLCVGCDLTGAVFHMGSAVLSQGEEGMVQLVYSEGVLFEHRQGVCGFEVHWLYDDSSVRFPDCDEPSGSHQCGTPPMPGGHPGLLCFCNASAPGHVEMVAITADGITPLPAGPAVLAEFRVSANHDADPGIYSVQLERPSEEHPEIYTVLCEGAQLETEQLGFLDGEIIVLE